MSITYLAYPLAEGQSMSTKLFGCFLSGLSAFVLFFASSASGAFIDLGTSGWEYEAPLGVTIPAPSTDGTGTVTTFTLQKFFWESESVILTFRTKANVTQVQHFFMMNLDVTNTVDWGGFVVELKDKYDPVGPPTSPDRNEPVHPIWAHIHPSHGVSGGPDYTPFTQKTPNTTVGVEKMTLDGGLLPASSVWTPSRFRLHDMSTQAYANDGEGIAGVMEFQLTLTPIAVPEPNTFLLMIGGCSLLGISRRRGRRAIAG
jgi:hypothetical protein